jgi:hypothetical protein
VTCMARAAPTLVPVMIRHRNASICRKRIILIDQPAKEFQDAMLALSLL